MTHHSKLNRWFQPGGHSDSNPNTIEVAFREAEEETGLKSLKFSKSGIFDIDIHPIPKREDMPQHLHYDIRFLLLADISENYIVTHESHDMKWIKLSDILKYSNEKAMLRMVEKAKRITNA